MAWFGFVFVLVHALDISRQLSFHHKGKLAGDCLASYSWTVTSFSSRAVLSGSVIYHSFENSLWGDCWLCQSNCGCLTQTSISDPTLRKESTALIFVFHNDHPTYMDALLWSKDIILILIVQIISNSINFKPMHDDSKSFVQSADEMLTRMWGPRRDSRIWRSEV